jgi:predicted TPR repeat methyltransferase
VAGKKPFTVDDAYSLQTPADSIRLYGEWASTYDSDFVLQSGYIQCQRVVEVFLRQQSRIQGAVLDIGCGTGIVGVELREAGIGVVDGLDISEPMLAEAGGKKTTAGDPVYRKLIAADVTGKLDVDSDQYAALISAGTFTLGHVGPEAFDELWRVAAPGALCAIGVRTTHYEQAGFATKLAAGVSNGLITRPDLVEIPIYSATMGRPEHANDKAYVVVCRVNK